MKLGKDDITQGLFISKPLYHLKKMSKTKTMQLGILSYLSHFAPIGNQTHSSGLSGQRLI